MLNNITDKGLKNIFTYCGDAPELDKDFPTAQKDFSQFKFSHRGYDAQFKLSINNERKLNIRITGISHRECDGSDNYNRAKKEIFDVLEERFRAQQLEYSTDEYGINITIRDLQKNDFFKDLAICKLHSFVQKLESDPDTLNKFAKDTFDILSDVESFLTEYDKLAEVQECRKFTSEKNALKNRTALAADKQYLHGAGYAADKLSSDIQRHKRVLIPNSPFWISIDIITGESVIRVNETLMYCNNLPTPYIEKLHTLLKQGKRFEVLNRKNQFGASYNHHDARDYSYCNGSNIYFCQLALKEMKSVWGKENKSLAPNSKTGIGLALFVSSIACVVATGILAEKSKPVCAVAASIVYVW